VETSAPSAPPRAPDPVAPRSPAAPDSPRAAPGSPTDLVDVADVAPTVRVDMRYATTRNFTGVAFYPVARCLLRRDAAERLARAQEALARGGLGLLVWDCYRPFSAQQKLWKLVHDPRYVARPVAAADGTPVEGSKHNRGAAVDLTLVGADGSAVEMPTDHDDFSARAHRDSREASPAARRNAAALEEALVAQGFVPLPTEWWHFDAPGWERYPLSDQPIVPAGIPLDPLRSDPDGDPGPPSDRRPGPSRDAGAASRVP
jgi:beta-N-acetylhexosaminidase/D-alanyl-D-alanine dipeptidase